MKAGDLLLFSACTWHKSPLTDPEKSVVVLQPSFAPLSSRISQHEKMFRWGDCHVKGKIGSYVNSSPDCFPQAFPRVEHGRKIAPSKVINCDWGDDENGTTGAICKNTE
eukprot:gnl/TRDRNA2_/TRDRNA2_81736_c0_seq1.p1 gnl/TRDRNA2_/TRDRNA2_81736_c0~~gnl/TRDRNA2_/TRDRNA2_81736_c0_seq1.p1  ORF type:complete len:109 (+),score=14.03 gnl/TRDRNA2_/TRDRNA2_81736_c0_seq1:268-594(+)